MGKLAIHIIVILCAALMTASVTSLSIATTFENNDQCSTCLPYVIKTILAVNGIGSIDGNTDNEQELMKRISKLEKTTEGLLRDTIELKTSCCTKPVLTPVPQKPPQKFTSCEAIKAAKPSSPSGKYDITINGKTVNVYCNMDPLCGDSKGGWMRVAYLDMEDTKQHCPPGFKLYEQSGMRACGRQSTGCQSVKFPSVGFSYSQVCGRVNGYQKGTVDASHYSIHHAETINKPYVDGVSITRGTPRQHLWTYMAGYSENRKDDNGCPCATDKPARVKPSSFVGNDYYCESGSPGKPNAKILYSNDLLWDGKMCNKAEQACCKHKDMPWFKKVIAKPIKDQIELRICGSVGVSQEDVPVSMYEIYVK